MYAKEKSIKYLKDNALNLNGFYCYELVYEALELAIQEAKKEVFDDIEKEIPKVTEWERVKGLKRINIFEELKQRHLPTFPKEKEHNNDFKKPCPSCNGTGNVPERGFEYPDLCCPTCNGQGFIKS